MRERPDGAALLDAARLALLDELLPLLPSEKQYPARMVASAMAIAAREARADTVAEAALLAAVPGEDGLAGLARAIRAGRHDPASPTHGAVRAWLEEYVRLRLAISSPRVAATALTRRP